MFNQSGTELTEKISRDSSNLGNLITRHITEFDHTVKNYGGELVGRLGQRTQDVAEALHKYVDTFDQRVTGRTGEISSTLDQRLVQFETLLGSRVSELAKTLAEGGKDVVSALDQRIGAVAGTINSRGTEVADAIGVRIESWTRGWAHALSRSPTISTAASAGLRTCWSVARKQSPAKSRHAAKQPPMRSMPGWNS